VYVQKAIKNVRSLDWVFHLLRSTSRSTCTEGLTWINAVTWRGSIVSDGPRSTLEDVLLHPQLPAVCNVQDSLLAAYAYQTPSPWSGNVQ
jgi:hypothetical protein